MKSGRGRPGLVLPLPPQGLCTWSPLHLGAPRTGWAPGPQGGDQDCPVPPAPRQPPQGWESACSCSDPG